MLMMILHMHEAYNSTAQRVQSFDRDNIGSIKWILASLTFFISLISLSPTFAAEEIRNTKIADNIEWHEGIKLTGPLHHFDLKIGAKINYDIGYINADNELQLAFPDFDGSHSNFRSLSASFLGHIFDAAEFKLEVDFANVKDIKDDWIRFTKGPILPHFTFGNMKEPFSLDMLTSSTYLTFMESALSTRALAPFRNIGVTVKGTWLGTRATWAGGYFLNTGSYSNVGEAQDQLSESNGSDLAGRITGLPLYESDGTKLVHLGLSYLHRFRNDNVENPTTQFRTRPESRLTDDRLVSTPLIYDQGQDLVCIEAAWMNGPVSIQGEYYHDFVNSLGTLTFKGWYLQGSWVLTGEARKYRISTGVFTGIAPNKEFNLRHSGWGAWELALRISEVDLNDKYILGGMERNITLGLNWHLRHKVRFMINYINAEVEDRADPLIYKGDADIVMSRIQLNF